MFRLYGELLAGNSPTTTTNPQTGGTSFITVCNCLFEYIHHYPPYLKAVSSIHGLWIHHTMVTKDPRNINLYILKIQNSGKQLL
jgi:hypothetical protein